jgi:hypothetical protein
MRLCARRRALAGLFHIRRRRGDVRAVEERLEHGLPVVLVVRDRVAEVLAAHAAAPPEGGDNEQEEEGHDTARDAARNGADIERV